METQESVREIDARIASTLKSVHSLVVEQADAEHNDNRRSGILSSLELLRDRPPRAAQRLARYDAGISSGPGRTIE